MTELFKNAPNFPHLLRVRSSELTAADEKRVFQPNSYVAIVAACVAKGKAARLC
jgi:hypothetical protein